MVTLKILEKKMSLKKWSDFILESKISLKNDDTWSDLLLYLEEDIEDIYVEDQECVFVENIRITRSDAKFGFGHPNETKKEIKLVLSELDKLEIGKLSSAKAHIIRHIEIYIPKDQLNRTIQYLLKLNSKIEKDYFLLIKINDQVQFEISQNNIEDLLSYIKEYDILMRKYETSFKTYFISLTAVSKNRENIN